MLDEKRYAFWTGLLSGLGIAAGLVLGWFAYEFAGLGATLDDFGGEVPSITRLVTSPLYLRAMPVVVLGLVILGNLWVKRQKVLLALVAGAALIGVGAVLLGYWGATLPMRQLGDDMAF